ncbi:hypothetical protein K432DRAFT_383562 [Lepidopterella palustris CBS 459.81]|uniref:Uncharacterized protein n=1 Tax=Lepidopterella palustris CBS 459.81 TaxID=1314670 RepID=A0A8E2E7L2_9PEZI|nr:hypothetical protein K432DRAFT_383562 [Lepidopterella palustris CBS 459.81]
MLPALQSSRPTYSPQYRAPIYPHQQTRSEQHQSGSSNASQATIPQSPYSHKPKNQIEAMPPFDPAPPAAFFASRANNLTVHSYDSAIRHPVFFTEQLRKPPFPLPEMASLGVNPAAHGYILENRRPDATVGQTKL